MNNETIILNERIRLLGDGILETTGRKTTIMTDEGEVEIDEPEPIYTLQEWGRKGYSVIKGQHCIAAIEIWLPRKQGKRADGSKEAALKISADSPLDITPKKQEFVKKKAFFFKRSQVKRRERSMV